MLKETHYFIIVVMVVILLMTLFTILLTYSLMPQEDQVPRRSRSVFMFVENQTSEVSLPDIYDEFSF